jgi:hypothetical protein
METTVPTAELDLSAAVTQALNMEAPMAKQVRPVVGCAHMFAVGCWHKQHHPLA